MPQKTGDRTAPRRARRPDRPPRGFIFLGTDDGQKERVSTMHIVKYGPANGGALVHTVCESAVVAQSPQEIDVLIDPSLIAEDLR